MAKKVVIVGGVAGGATTAARLRRLDEQTEIVMIERGEYISFANCGLPYYIGGAIQERDALLVQTVEGMSKKFNMDIRNLSEVTRIDRERKVVEIKNLKTSETYEENYDVLVFHQVQAQLSLRSRASMKQKHCSRFATFLILIKSKRMLMSSSLRKRQSSAAASSVLKWLKTSGNAAWK